MNRGDVVYSIGEWRDNAEMLADIAAHLPYLSGSVLDATYGQGTWWRDFKPEPLTTNDLYKPADHAYDFRAMPFRDGEFDTVAFDPDYKLNGTPALDEFDERYGIGEQGVNRETRMAKIRDGAVECYRVSRLWTLVKCQDQVEGGIVRWQTDMVTRAIEDVGGRKADIFHLRSKGMPQPTGWRATPTDESVKPRTFKELTVGEWAKARTALGSAITVEDEERLRMAPEQKARAWLAEVGGGSLRDLDRGQKTARKNYSTLLVFARKDYAP